MEEIAKEENIAYVQRDENGSFTDDNSGQIGLDGYEIGKLLGKGQYSSVYIGRKRDVSQQIVAIKRVEIFELKEKTRKKCLREVRLLQSLDHPHIIKCHNAFIQDNELIIILEWAERGDLRRLIRKAAKEGKQFAEKDVWAWSYQICHAIQHMHERRIMHRDIKPANIFVTASGVLKLGDLGLGRHFSYESVQAFSKVGTPLYMSPDVLDGGGYDWKSDVWSVGVLLYELATLKSPFMQEDSNLYAIYRKIQKGEFDPLPERLSLPFREIIGLMLQVDPNARPDMKTVCDMILKVVSPPERNLPAEEELEEDVDLIFEATLDKLKILDYENNFCRPMSLPSIHGLYFLSPQEDHRSQFMYFAHLAAWLMTLSQYPAQQPDNFSDPNEIAKEILSDLRQMGVPLEYPASRLCIGYGFAVCDVLDRLCDLVLSINQVQFYLPNHLPEYYSEEPETDDIIDESDALVQPDPPLTFESDPDHLAVEMQPNSTQEPSSMIVSAIDPKLWDVEVKRVTSQLKVVVKDSSRWESRLDVCHQVQKVFVDHTPPTHDGLKMVAEGISRDLSAMNQREQGVNEKFAEQRRQYGEHSAKLKEATSLYESSSTKLTALTAQLSQLQSELEQAKNAMDTKAQEIADATPVKRIQEAIKLIRGEMKRMDLEIGIQQSFLSSFESKNKKQGKRGKIKKMENDDFDEFD